MRRSGHPSRPRAITCCFFASLKTLLISTKATCLTPKSTSRASFSLAGFQVTLIGRFWVTPGDPLARARDLGGLGDSAYCPLPDNWNQTVNFIQKRPAPAFPPEVPRG